MLQSPRLTMTIDALMRVYDHVILDAGSLDDIPEQLVATNAHAVLIATGLDAATREVVRKELLGAGFRGVTMLDAAGRSRRSSASRADGWSRRKANAQAASANCATRSQVVAMRLSRAFML